jgi:hypothetical protein
MHGLMRAKGTAAGVALVLATILSACSGDPQAVPSSPAPTTTPIPLPSPQPALPPPDARSCSTAQPGGALDQAWRDTWGLWGAATPPPRELVTAPAVPANVQNLTNSAIPDATAAAWATGLQRTLVTLTWTQAHLEDGFYASALNPVADAPKAYAALPLTYQRLRLDGVVYHCFDANTRFVGFNLVRLAAPSAGASDYAFVVQEQLAFKDLYIYKDGHSTPVWGPLFVGNPQPKLRVLAGGIRTNAMLGDVWYVTRDTLCTRRGDPADPCQAYGITPPE